MKDEPVVEVEAPIKALADKPQVTLHLDRDPNDPRVPKGTVLEALKKGEALKELQKIPLHGTLKIVK